MHSKALLIFMNSNFFTFTLPTKAIGRLQSLAMGIHCGFSKKICKSEHRIWVSFLKEIYCIFKIKN